MGQADVLPGRVILGVGGAQANAFLQASVFLGRLLELVDKTDVLGRQAVGSLHHCVPLPLHVLDRLLLIADPLVELAHVLLHLLLLHLLNLQHVFHY